MNRDVLSATYGEVDEHIQSASRCKQQNAPSRDLEVELVLRVAQHATTGLHAPLCEGVEHLGHTGKGLLRK